MRKTKIICTLGPATDEEGVMEELIKSGMDVARFNFSHSNHQRQLIRINKLKELREKHGRHVAALLDTKGPEIRLKEFKNGKVTVNEGDKFTLTTKDIEGDETKISVTYKDLPKDLSVGNRVLIDDGLIELRVDELTDTDIICTVINGGIVSSTKGVNVPDVKLAIPYLSEQDKKDILFGIENEYDFIAASFVSSASDVLQVRRILEENGCYTINIIAKIENMEGVKNIDEIIQVSDGIMIARGDMGVEIPAEDVPIYQKMIIKKVYSVGKQVITATQMLESMVKNPRPTRAETADVANAIYDGTSAIMLSGETAAGKYPVESLNTMVRIALRTESDVDYRKRFFGLQRKANPNVVDAISHAAVTTALDLNARYIIALTKSGTTAKLLSRYRPSCDIIACTTHAYVARQMNLSWGVTPIIVEEKTDPFELIDYTVDKLLDMGLVETEDKVVYTGGVPLKVSGTTNMIKVHIVERK